MRFAALVRLLLFTFLSLLATAEPSLAQDPRDSAAQAAARDWLTLADREDFQGSFNASGKKFQATISADRWGEGLKREHERYGKLVQRGVLKTTFQTSLPGAPDGDYAMVIFRTAFAKKDDAGETVTLEREPDGVWRVVGYLIS